MKTTSVHQRLETPTETETQEHVYQKPVTYVYELKWHMIDICQQPADRSVTRLFLLRVSKPKANTLNNCYDVFLYDM